MCFSKGQSHKDRHGSSPKPVQSPRPVSNRGGQSVSGLSNPQIASLHQRRFTNVKAGSAIGERRWKRHTSVVPSLYFVQCLYSTKSQNVIEQNKRTSFCLSGGFDLEAPISFLSFCQKYFCTFIKLWVFVLDAEQGFYPLPW